MRFLIAIDGSDCAKRAFDKLLHMAHPERDTVYLIAVGADMDLQEDYKRELVSRLEQTLAPYKEQLKEAKINSEVITEFGDPKLVIIEETKKNSIDVLVMGNRGISANFTKVADLMLGSVSQYCLINVQCGVLLVK